MVTPSILAFDTAFSACSVGLLTRKQIYTRHLVLPMQQAKLILQDIESLLLERQLTLSQLDAIAFGCGPASFTGVRIAATVAQSLAYAGSLPVIRISSLQALAQTAYEQHGWQRVITAVDARMGRVYWGEFQLSALGLMEPVGMESALKLEEITLTGSFDHKGQGEETEASYGVGDGWALLSTALPLKGCDTRLIPHASALLTIAREKFAHRDFVPIPEALPTYF